MSSILTAFLSRPLCVKAAPHDRTSYFIRCRTLNSEAHVSLFYYGCEHTRDWYGSLHGRFPHNGLFILLLCIYYDLCLAPCTFTVNRLLLLLLLLHWVHWNGEVVVVISLLAAEKISLCFDRRNGVVPDYMLFSTVLIYRWSDIFCICITLCWINHVWVWVWVPQFITALI